MVIKLVCYFKDYHREYSYTHNFKAYGFLQDKFLEVQTVTGTANYIVLSESYSSKPFCWWFLSVSHCLTNTRY